MYIIFMKYYSKPKAPYAYFWFSFANYAGTLYSGNLKALLDEDLEFGDDLPHSIAYTINGEPGDLCPCAKGMVVDYCAIILLQSKMYISYMQCL